MQLDEKGSNKILFDGAHGQVTSDCELWQKNNNFFEGRKLADGITENFEEAIKPFEEAFESLKSQLADVYLESGSIPEGQDKDRLWANCLKEAAAADAIGDFDTLLGEIKNHIDGMVEKVTPDEAPEADTEDQEPIEDAVGDGSNGDAEVESAPEPEGKPEAEPESASEAKAEVDVTENVSGDSVDTETEPEVAETEDTESQEKAEPASEVDKTAESEEATEEELTPDGYFQGIADEARDLAKLSNWGQAAAALEALQVKWNEGPEGADETIKTQAQTAIKEAQEEVINNRAEYQKKQEEKKEKNFSFREELLARFQKIVDEGKWSAQGEVQTILRKFENARPLPNKGIEDQDAKLAELKNIFDENRVGYLVQARQKEEDNLTGKLITIEKIENIIENAGKTTSDWEALNTEIEELNRQFRKIGRVPKERDSETWTRFRATRDAFIEKRMAHDKSFKKELDKSIAKRKKLIEKAQALSGSEDLASASVEINKLHSEWRKLTNIPKELNDEYWNQFKEASDNFNKIKSENIDTLRDQEQQNLDAKTALCEKIEKIIEEGDFKGSTKNVEGLFAEWKNIGPVPKKKSNSIWQRFRKAMDNYYKHRRDHYKDIRNEQQENLKKKNEIIRKIAEHASAEEPESVLPEIKTLQDEYQSIGFVPIKQKDKLWKAYREASDLFYNKLREKGRPETGRQRPSKSPDKQLGSEIFRLRKEAESIREQIMKYNDTKTYFKPNKKGMELRNEIQKNIDEAEVKLQEKLSRIDELSKELDAMDNGQS